MRSSFFWTITFIVLVLVLVLVLSEESYAFLNLTVLRPTKEFTTNNQELEVEGLVECPDVSEVVVSFALTGGADLSTIQNSIHSATLDLLEAKEVIAIAIKPKVKDGLSFGPRRISVSTSIDGMKFEPLGDFNVPSGSSSDDGYAKVGFSPSARAKFLRLNTIDSWQAKMTSILSLEIIDNSKKRFKPSLRDFSILLNLSKAGKAGFKAFLLLKEGPNSIQIIAEVADPNPPRDINLSDSHTLSVSYIPELTAVESDQVHFFDISDGYKARLLIPVLALEENVKKVKLIQADPSQISSFSYLRNEKIVRGTAPVVAYRFEASKQIPFPVFADAFLKGQPPSLAVDGKLNHPSTWITNLLPLPISLWVDFRQVHTISKVVIYSHVDRGQSFAPERATILTSSETKDVKNPRELDDYIEVKTQTGFKNQVTEIPLPAQPEARYVKIVIGEGKQGNNIQINEIEFKDASGSKIVSYSILNALILQRPAIVQLSYSDDDLIRANIKSERNLAVFAWNPQMREWQFVGGMVDQKRNRITVQLNYLAELTVFEAESIKAEVLWSFNPFSPNDDGIADTTRMTVDLKKPQSGGKSFVEVTVQIFDLAGRLVNTLVDRESVEPTSLSVQWNGKDKNGKLVEIGTYIYQVKIDKEVRNGVIVVAK